MEFGYPFATWYYLGYDAEYHYAVDQASTVLRLDKKLAPLDELSQVLRHQCQREQDFLALDLDLPWVDSKPSDAFYQWREKSHLDRSLYEQIEKTCQDSRSKGD
jgi:hypothetical protein